MILLLRYFLFVFTAPGRQISFKGDLFCVLWYGRTFCLLEIRTENAKKSFGWLSL